MYVTKIAGKMLRHFVYLVAQLFFEMILMVYHNILSKPITDFNSIYVFDVSSLA